MPSPQDSLQEQLQLDVHALYKEGFSPDIEPRRIPALAELAKALSPKAKSYGQAAEAGLKQAIYRAGDQLLPVFHKVDRPRILNGLEKLLGLFDDSPGPLRERANIAGPMLGFPNGYEGLRGAKLNGVKRYDLAITHIVSQLLTLSAEIGFVYTEVFVPTQPDDSRTKEEALNHKRLTELDFLLRAARSEHQWVSLQPMRVRSFHYDIDYELGKLVKRELRVFGPSDTRTLLDLAHLTYQDGGRSFIGFSLNYKVPAGHTVDAVKLLEAFLIMVVNLTTTKPMQPGLEALLSLREYRSSPLAERLKVRESYFGIKRDAGYSLDLVEQHLLDLLASQAVKVAVRLGRVSVIEPVGVWFHL
jgi:hypothetical protein